MEQLTIRQRRQLIIMTYSLSFAHQKWAQCHLRRCYVGCIAYVRRHPSIHPSSVPYPSPKNNLNGLTMTQKPNEYKAIPKQYTSVDDRVTSSYKKQNKTEQSRTQPSRTKLRTQLCYRIESGRLYRLFVCLKCQTLLSNSLPKAASNTNELCLNGDPGGSTQEKVQFSRNTRRRQRR